MKTLKTAIHFIEPIRVLEWHDDKDRNSAPFLRGYGFARWHNSNESGKPYITGTLVRSAMIRAVEQILWLKDGVFMETPCCPGAFKDSNARMVRRKKARRLRRRQTLSWNSGKKICQKDAASPCLFCLFLGRCDKAGAEEEKKLVEDKNRYDVKFSNFDSPFREDMPLAALAQPRIVNRVDQEDGKAEDFFKIWEIDHETCGVFTGQIHLSDRADTPEMAALLAEAAALVDTVAGSLCWIDVQVPATASDAAGPDVRPLSAAGGSLFDDWAREVRNLFNAQGKTVHLRMFADVVRELRRHSPEKVLPRGHVNRQGELEDHFVWDMRVKKKPDLKLRDWLPEKFSESRKAGYSWRRFCENLGQALYDQAKKAAPDQFSSQRPVGSGQAIQMSQTPATELTQRRKETLFEHLITGWLVAQTPFFFGWTRERIVGEQTSLQLLTTADGRLRFPRSALRGVLRRDLADAFGGGCRAELGHAAPCACPVCSLMRTITLKDSRSTFSEPAQVRHRIRLNPGTGTVDQGALFDMEVAPRGASFPFELRMRSRNRELPEQLTTVLAWWAEGNAAFSGAAGTGKGRFALTGLRHCRWNLDKDLPDYSRNFGGRREGAPPKSEPLEVRPAAPSPWRKMDETLSVISPFLTGDPIAGMLDPAGADAVCFQTFFLDENGKKKPEPEYMLKGESVRGLLRTAVGRRHPETTLDTEHEECGCVLCRIFGNQRKVGKVRVEDFRAIGSPQTKIIDRVAIDRFTGGAKDQHKFDMAPLVGTVRNPIDFKGKIWIASLSDDDQKTLETALADIRSGLYPLGGFGGVGLGWVSPGKTGETTPAPQSLSLAPGASVKPALGKDKIYWPHYFLRFADAKVVRENEPPGHDRLDAENLYTGRLVCVLKTKTPLIIPDGENVQTDENNHKTYDFFNLNGEHCIPGSEIKGMISSVFEALTNSCLRVFDEKKRLSWRMAAKNLDEWKPGRMIEKDGQLFIQEMEEMRLPVYDNPKLANDIQAEGEKGFYRKKKIKAKNGNFITKKGQPTPADKLINQNAADVRSLMTESPELRDGLEDRQWFRCFPHGVDSFALQEKPDIKCGKGKSGDFSGFRNGYLHFTGPNKVEIEKLTEKDSANPKEKNLPIERLTVVHNKVELEKTTVNSSKYGEVERDRAIPQYAIVSGGYKYSMKKRCERVFIPLRKKTKPLAVSTDVESKFRELCRAYVENADNIPPVFRTLLPKGGKLSDGNLIYFKRKFADSGDVTDIIPVRISRIVDDHVLGEKLRDDFRPCVREILDADQAAAIKDQGVKALYQHHPEGLCPACALFGTSFYKGRVAFGFAFPKDGAAPKMANNGDSITLPLLERPRPTWSMPRRKIKETGQGDASKTAAKGKKNPGKSAAEKVQKQDRDVGDPVPGRKFYVHHQGWKRVIQKSKDGKEPQTENNRSVQAAAPDQEFSFEIRFENLRHWELGLLIYAVNLEPGMAHKLGMGKPLGFGSVDISVTEVVSEKPVDVNHINAKAVEQLNRFWDCGTVGELAEKLGDLFNLLFYQDDDNIRVRYPALRQEDDPEEKPGYVELGNEKGTFKPDRRQEKLKAVWRPWH